MTTRRVIVIEPGTPLIARQAKVRKEMQGSSPGPWGDPVEQSEPILQIEFLGGKYQLEQVTLPGQCEAIDMSDGSPVLLIIGPWSEDLNEKAALEVETLVRSDNSYPSCDFNPKLTVMPRRTWTDTPASKEEMFALGILVASILLIGFLGACLLQIIK